MEQEGMKYARILDYKTGSDEFKLSDILYGLNLQLFLYMMAVCEVYKDVKPAGMLRLKLIRPNINTDRSTDKDFSENEIIKGKNKTWRMDGIILNDEKVIIGMEKDVKSQFIPVRKEKTGEFKSANLMGLDEINIVMKYVFGKIKNMVKTLSEGKIDALPIKNKRNRNNNTFCNYCYYKSICGFESDICKEVTEMSNEIVIRKIQEENEVKNA
jgi:ATP-dependent helicase/nuclease subunit B